MNIENIEEGGWCPECITGVLEIYSEHGCSCFIIAPCSSCTNAILKCSTCGWDTDDDMPTVGMVESQVMRFE